MFFIAKNTLQQFSTKKYCRTGTSSRILYTRSRLIQVDNIFALSSRIRKDTEAAVSYDKQVLQRKFS